MKPIWLVLLFSGIPLALLGQGNFTGPNETFLEMVDPLITQGEVEIYQSLKDYSSRDYFHSIFWYKRDPQPDKAGNIFKKEYFERRQLANLRFGERGVAGTETDRGKVFLLMGHPDESVQETVLGSSLGSGIKEVWVYKDEGVSFSFLVEIGGTRYRQIEPADPEVIERLKQSKILDRAEPFRLNVKPISLPNIGATKDIENLVVKDRQDLDTAISYSCFKSDTFQTEVFVGVTVNETLPGGFELNLTVFDPYENKVLDVKKKISSSETRYVDFSVALDPDQYQMVLRVSEKATKKLTVDRRFLDVPDFQNTGPQFSGIVWGDSMQPIPVEGFDTAKRFVFQNRYLNVQNQVKNHSNIFLMLETYGIDTETFVVLVDDRVVAEKPVQEDGNEQKKRLLFEVPASEWGEFHEIRIVGGDGNQKFAKSFYLIDGKPVTQKEIMDSFQSFRFSDDFKWLLPRSDRIEELSMIAIEAPPGIQPKAMYVYQNYHLIAQKAEAPWQVEISEGLINVSGVNEFTVIFSTDQGPKYLTRTFQPLRIDQTIKTRAMNVTFNAYRGTNEFVPDIDLEKLSVFVDEKQTEPLSVKKEASGITYLFLVDKSYSMKDSFVGNIRAIKKFISMMRPIDSGYFIQFSDNYFQLNEPTRSKEVLKAVADSIELQKLNPQDSDRLYRENTTFVYDAIIAGIHTMIEHPGRKAAIVVTDGIAIEGVFTPNALLSYARENEVVIHSLWLDNNPRVTTDEFSFLRKEMGRGEKIARAIGLSRYFAKKDNRKNIIGQKIKRASISEGLMQMLAEESGGFHYQVFKADRSLIQAYIDDIENAMGSQYLMTLMLPISDQIQEVELDYPEDGIFFRLKSAVKVRKTNPLAD